MPCWAEPTNKDYIEFGQFKIDTVNFWLLMAYMESRRKTGSGESRTILWLRQQPRKFLEAYLFFKYPYHDDKSDAFERINKFFGKEEDTAIALVNRLNNEFSHLAEVPDRGFKPVEIPEIAKVANYVLDKIYTSDKVQYNSLLKSIGEPERTN